MIKTTIEVGPKISCSILCYVLIGRTFPPFPSLRSWNGVVIPELVPRVKRLLQAFQLLDPPILIPIHLLKALRANRIVDIRMLLGFSHASEESIPDLVTIRVPISGGLGVIALPPDGRVRNIRVLALFECKRGGRGVNSLDTLHTVALQEQDRSIETSVSGHGPENIVGVTDRGSVPGWKRGAAAHRVEVPAAGSAVEIVLCHGVERDVVDVGVDLSDSRF